jgi:AAA+ ATPase superfamily predicted ATPase
MFSDRKDEMNLLRQHYKLTQEKSQLLVIYGRRRVGKTTLVKEFLKEKFGNPNDFLIDFVPDDKYILVV